MITIPEGWYLAAIDYHTPDVDPKDGIAGRWFFLVRNGYPFASAVRACAAAWVALERQRAVTKGAKRVFDNPQNWGDWIANCPAELCEAYGLRFVELPFTRRILVDHDETVGWEDGALGVLEPVEDTY